MKNKTRNNLRLLACSVLCLLLAACAPLAEQKRSPASSPPALATTPPLPLVANKAEMPHVPGQLPVRYQKPSYTLDRVNNQGTNLVDRGEISIPIGADISSNTGPVSLRDILKRLAALKNMNVSWASDVDQMALVDVDIRAEDDFFKAIDNLLRQKDYFHEVQDNTIVVKYRETKKFHVAMPFLTSKYQTGVGGDVLGASGSNSITGIIKLTSEGNTFDIWANIRKNIDQILDIWEETTTTTQEGQSQTEASNPPADPKAADKKSSTKQETKKSQTSRRNTDSAKGFYNIDQPIGLITVSAPRPLIAKIDTYLKNLTEELYKQISIEAKIIEVSLTDGSTTGINWSNVLSNRGINFELFGSGTGGSGLSTGLIYPAVGRMVSAVSVTNPFTLVLDAIQEQGDTKVLANPRISVMNGQPALISIGENVKYIDSVDAKVEDGVITYSVKTSSVMSGLGMSVVATVLGKDEIILSLTPVTSKLTEPIEYRNFGTGNQVGLPRVKLREMNTLVKIKNGEMLMIGGLIDNTEEQGATKVPLLGDLPGVGSLFKSSTKDLNKKELIILLQPKIL